MDGVSSVLRDNPRIRLGIAETKDLRSAEAPAFRHAKVGRNRFPLEKLDEFVSLSCDLYGRGGIAMVKVCYEDVGHDTGAQSLFDEYRRAMDDLRHKRRDLTIVHVTMPLTEPENWKGLIRKTLLRRPTERDRNVVRNRYNDLLRHTYANRDPIFDLALLESTLPDGSRASFRRGSYPVYTLAAQYTTDGGHLNTFASRILAEQFLVMLAGISS